MPLPGDCQSNLQSRALSAVEVGDGVGMGNVGNGVGEGRGSKVGEGLGASVGRDVGGGSAVGESVASGVGVPPPSSIRVSRNGVEHAAQRSASAATAMVSRLNICPPTNPQ